MPPPLDAFPPQILINSRPVYPINKQTNAQVAQPPEPGRAEGRLEAGGGLDHLPVPPQPRQPVGRDRQALARKV